MRTAIVSDLHLGTLSGSDVARHPAARDRLVEAVSGADRVVTLGDVLELRERPIAESLALARPLFESLGEVLSGRRLVVVAGNHDHALGEPWLGRLDLDGLALGPEREWKVEAGDGPLGRLAGLMPEVELAFAYPGLHLRPDVYATHGHYLDLHLTVPRLESIAASAMGRLTGRGSACRSAQEYEAVLAPLYGFYDGLARGAAPGSLVSGSTISRRVWERATDGGRASRLLIGGIAIPGAVAALNGLGLGPFRAELTGEELRRSGLLAMARVAETLAPGAGHIVFGHTHRPGPLPEDEPAEWTTLSGARLWNSGSWFHERAFVGAGDRRSPYWPGTVLFLDDEGPPRRENVLADWELP